jgi:hypothetical protein
MLRAKAVQYYTPAIKRYLCTSAQMLSSISVKVPGPEMSSPASLRLSNSKGPRLKTIKSRKPEPFKPDVDTYVTDLLEEIDDGKTVLRLRKDEKVFSQGDSANAIYFIQTVR